MNPLSGWPEITGHNIEVKVNPDFVRENEIKILRGNRKKLDGVTGRDRGYEIRETLKWLLLS